MAENDIIEAQGEPIIIGPLPKEEEEHHHGGNWKIVYADFVTAMMAFFLLLWILNALEDEQLEGVSNYFEKSDATEASPSGAGSIFGGVTFNEIGQIDLKHHTTGIDLEYSLKRHSDAKVKKLGKTEESDRGDKNDLKVGPPKKFNDIKKEIEQSLKKIPKHLNIFRNAVEVVLKENGVYIQFYDQTKQSFFYPNSKKLTKEAEQLVKFIGHYLLRIKNRVVLVGYADDETAIENAMELSINRASSIRHALEVSGVNRQRINVLIGRGRLNSDKNIGILSDGKLKGKNLAFTIAIVDNQNIIHSDFKEEKISIFGDKQE